MQTCQTSGKWSVNPIFSTDYKQAVKKNHYFYPVPRLLLLDDDQLYTSIFSDHNATVRFDVTTINSCNDLNYLEGKAFDVAVVDLNLGSTLATELTGEIKSLFGPIPIIIISSDDFDLNDSQKNSGIWEFLPKSIGIEAILDSVFDTYVWWNINTK